MTCRSSLLFALIFSFLAAGCGASFYRPSESWRVRPEAPLQVDDADIRVALEARPQLPESPRIAYFTFDREHAEELGEMLGALPGVSGVYEIAPLMVTGQRRFEIDDPSGPRQPEPREVNMRHLRLLAARAHCDVLVVADRSSSIRRDPNGWVALAPLVVPLFFAPFMDYEVQSYLDVYVTDVRNGYLYGHLASHEEERVDERTLYEDPVQRMMRDQLATLLDQARVALTALLTEGEINQLPVAAL